MYYSMQLDSSQNYVIRAYQSKISIFSRVTPNYDQRIPNILNGDQNVVHSEPEMLADLSRRCIVSNNYLYFSKISDGLFIFKVDATTQLLKKESLYKPLKENYEGVAPFLKNSNQLIVGATSVHFVDSSNKTNLKTLNVTNFGYNNIDADHMILIKEETLLFVAGGKAGLLVVNIKDFNHPEFILQIYHTYEKYQSASIENVKMSDDQKYMYVCYREMGIITYDIQDVKYKKIKQIGVYFSDGVEDMQLSGDNSFYVVANRQFGIQLVDISDQTNPKLISSLFVEGKTFSVSLIEKDKFFLCASIIKGQVQLVDIRNKFNPLIIQKYEVQGYSNSDYICLSPNKETAYVALHNSLLIIPLYQSSVKFNIDKIIIQSGSSVLKKKIIPDSSYIFQVGEVVNIKLIQIYPKKSISITNVQYYYNFQMYGLPSWAIFSMNDQILQVEITSQGLDEKSDSISHIQFIFQAKEILSKLDFVKLDLNITEEKSGIIFSECRRRNIVDASDRVIVSSQEFIREVFSSYSGAVKKIFYQPVDIQYQKSLSFIREKSKESFPRIKSISGVVKITITINKSDGKLLKILYPGVLSYYTEDEDEIRVEGKKADINKIFQNHGFRLANNTNPENINLIMTIDDYINNPLKIKFLASDIQLIKLNNPVQKNQIRTLQDDFSEQFSKSQIYILSTFSYTINLGVFIDQDEDKLSLSAQVKLDGEYQKIPESFWLSFQADDRTFYGSTKVSQYGDIIELKITATDGYTKTSDNLRIYIKNIPIQYIIQILLQILGPIIGILGLWKYKSKLINSVKRKEYQSMPQQFQINQEFVIQIPLLEDRLQIAQKIWSQFLKIQNKTIFINELNFIKEISINANQNNEKNNQINQKNDTELNHNFVSQTNITATIYSPKKQLLLQKKISYYNELFEQFSCDRRQRTTEQYSENKLKTLENTQDQSSKDKEYNSQNNSQFKIVNNKSLQQKNQFSFCQNDQRENFNEVLQFDNENNIMNSNQNYDSQTIIKNERKISNYQSPRAKQIISRFKKSITIFKAEQKQFFSKIKEKSESYLNSDGQLNIQFILDNVKNFCSTMKNKSHFYKFINELDSKTSKSSHCIIGLCAMSIISFEPTSLAIIQYLKQIAIQQGYTVSEWYKAYVQIVPEPNQVQYDPFPSLLFNDDAIYQIIASFQSQLLEDQKISQNLINLLLPLIKQVIKAYTFGITYEKLSFFNKIRGQCLEIFSHNILCLKTYKPIVKRSWLICGKQKEVLIEKEFSENTSIPSWINKMDISNNVLLIQGKMEHKDIGEHVLKIYDQQRFILKEMRFITKDNYIKEIPITQIIEQTNLEDSFNIIFDEQNTKFQNYDSKQPNINNLNEQI